MKKILYILIALLLLLPITYAVTSTNITTSPGTKWVLVTCPWENLYQEDGIISCTSGGVVEEKEKTQPMWMVAGAIIIIGIIYYLNKYKK